ncbi:hypothetical protein AB0L82_37630 [Nocardia sp. NPDC052001]
MAESAILRLALKIIDPSRGTRPGGLTERRIQVLATMIRTLIPNEEAR